MREHYTTVTGWQMCEKLDGLGIRLKKELATSIEGCPYEINLEIVLDEVELKNMGYDEMDASNIAYDLGLIPPAKEVDAQALMWEHINKVKMIMSQHDTNSWRLEQWDANCSFLFASDPTLPDEEAMQEERDTWV